MVNEYFLGVQSRMSGIGLTGIEKKLTDLHEYAYSDSVQTLPIGGIYRYRNGGEKHAFEGSWTLPQGETKSRLFSTLRDNHIYWHVFKPFSLLSWLRYYSLTIKWKISDSTVIFSIIAEAKLKLQNQTLPFP